jgi:predicted nucleic acid-binding protein
MSQENTAKPICLFFDANIWRKEQLLNSSIGAALLYSLSRLGGRIALPEVTEKEVIWRTVITGREAVNDIRKNLAMVRSLIGTTDEIELPPDTAFEEAAKTRFGELDDILIRVETTLDHYRSALRRVIEASAPNTTKEQYRDSLLWEAVVQLLPHYRVVLITNDFDFCESRKFEKGLAKDLIKECEQLNSVVTLHVLREALTVDPRFHPKSGGLVGAFLGFRDFRFLIWLTIEPFELFTTETSGGIPFGEPGNQVHYHPDALKVAVNNVVRYKVLLNWI